MDQPKNVPITPEVQEAYGNRIRVRASGLCIREDELLMVNHRKLYGHDFWAPPGGGIAFLEPSTSALEREFLEETGYVVEIGAFLFSCEFIQSPLHAIELFYEVEPIGGQLRTGVDPELHAEGQIIQDVRFIPWADISKMPDSHIHGIFKKASNPSKIPFLKGHFKL